MRQQTRKVKTWAYCLLAACALLLAMGVCRHLTFGVGRSDTTWRLARDWHVESWSGRQRVTVDNDEGHGQPKLPPCQAYQYRGKQFGPVVVVTRFPVPLIPGEICE